MPEEQQPTPINTTEPAQPLVTAEPTITPSVPTTQKVKKSSPKWLLPVIIAGVVALLLGAGAYGYMGIYMQTPENLWKQSVKNTGKGFSDFVNQPMQSQKGGKVAGTFKVTYPVAADGTISGSYDDKSTQVNASVGASGVRANLELRGLTQDAANSQDIYVKVDGLNTVGSLLGGTNTELGSLVSSIDGKWYVLDHTLLDQATATLKEGDTKTPTAQEVQKEAQDLSKKFAVILNERLFTTDEKNAVVIVKEKLAKEDFKGRKSQHVKVQVRKDQLRSMVIALKDAAKDTKVKDWLVMGDTNKTFEEALDFDSLLKDIDNANYDNAVADVWLDTGLKFVRNVRINAVDKKDPNKVTGSVDFMLDYTGGDELPLSITITNQESDKNKGSINLGMNINKKSYIIKFTAAVDGNFDGQKVNGNADLTVTPSGDTLKVEKPTGAKNILELVGGLMGQTSDLQTQLSSPSGSDFSGILDDLQLQ